MTKPTHAEFTRRQQSARERAAIIRRARAALADIEQYFVDVASWNDNATARQAGCDPIDPDPDEPESVDACATDPPYGIGFLGREWDTFTSATVEKIRTSKAFGSDEANPNLRGRTGWAGSAAVAYDRSAAASLKFHAWTQQWAEAVLRVLKPGAHAVVCASPRMGHRVTCGLEDAGFEIRDSLLWLYGSGFPKSLNLPGGLGTALKPAYEPVILARKPLGGRTVGQCVAEFGTGALNIDGCRLDGAMRWLVRLVTPTGGLVLDPFVAGSGTTGLACIKEQCRFLGIEREAAYVAIANARLHAEHARFETGGPLFAEVAAETPEARVMP